MCFPDVSRLGAGTGSNYFQQCSIQQHLTTDMRNVQHWISDSIFAGIPPVREI
jgi:hypothetical protein